MNESKLCIWEDAETPLSCLPFFCSRTCRQMLSLAETPCLKRTIEGKLMNLAERPLKYASKIFGHDLAPPALEKITNANELWVDCVVKLTASLNKNQKAIALSRLAAPFSVLIETPDETFPLKTEKAQKHLTWPHDIPEKSFISYRPRLKMRLVNFSLETNEWKMTNQWQLELAEI
ncbi:MAG: hypothetical protein ACPGUZ_03670 [Holosporaceae bacterium]